MGNSLRLHLMHVTGYLYLGVDVTNKDAVYMLVRDEDLQEDCPADRVRAMLLMMGGSQAVENPVSIRNHDSVFYGIPLDAETLKTIPLIVNYLSALGYAHSSVKALSMQAVLPGLN